MLKLGIPVGNVHCTAFVGCLDTALYHLLTVKKRLHRIVTRTGNVALGGCVAKELSVYPAGTEAGGTDAVFLYLVI